MKRLIPSLLISEIEYFKGKYKKYPNILFCSKEAYEELKEVMPMISNYVSFPIVSKTRMGFEILEDISIASPKRLDLKIIKNPYPSTGWSLSCSEA